MKASFAVTATGVFKRGVPRNLTSSHQYSTVPSSPVRLPVGLHHVNAAIKIQASLVYRAAGIRSLFVFMLLL